MKRNKDNPNLIQLCEQTKIGKRHPLWDECDRICLLTKNIGNVSLHRNRKIYFKNEMGLWMNEISVGDIPFESAYEQFSLLKDHEAYQALPAKVAQEAIKMSAGDISNFVKAHTAWEIDHKKFPGEAEPQITNYKGSTEKDRKDGRMVAVYNIQALYKEGLENGYIHCSMSNIRLKSKVVTKANKNPEKFKINLVRIVPKGRVYNIEVVYTEQKIQHKQREERIASMDVGVCNIATIGFNFKQAPLIWSGKSLIDLNPPKYTHVIGKSKSKLNVVDDYTVANEVQGVGSSKHIDYQWKNYINKNRHMLHCITSQIVDRLIRLQIGTLVIGNNKNWKQKSKMGRRNNRHFVQMPLKVFIEMLKYKCELNHIEVVLQEESYTSKASFLDLDEMPVYNPDRKTKPVFSGTRVSRNLYRSSNGTELNADVNAAYNIMRKAFDKFSFEIDFRSLVSKVWDFVVHPVYLNGIFG